ncbi:MAG: hypothetical protein U0575_13065 [Phycisphaerales bacterium]
MPSQMSLSSLPLADIHREIARRQQHHPKLRLRREQLMKEVAAIDAELGGAASVPARRGPGRPKGSKNTRSAAGAPAAKRSKNKVSLVDALSAALKGKTMSIGEAMAAVRKAGYKSDSPNFRTTVNIALIKKDRFKREGKGRYTAV